MDPFEINSNQKFPRVNKFRLLTLFKTWDIAGEFPVMYMAVLQVVAGKVKEVI